MHNLYKPLPGKFKDYLAIPKANGYQSLHTSLFGPHGVAIEVQIRTVEMDHFAESGIAAHWIYKEGESSTTTAQSRALEWLKNLLEMQQKSGSSQEFLEERQGRPVSRRNLRLHSQGRYQEAAARRDRGRFCLRGAYRRRQYLRRRAHRSPDVAARQSSLQRPDHRDHLFRGQSPASELARLRHHRQGAHQYSAFPQVAAKSRGDFARSAPAAAIGQPDQGPRYRDLQGAASRRSSTSTTCPIRRNCSPKSVSAIAIRAWWPRPCTTSRPIPRVRRLRQTARDQGHRGHGGVVRQVLPAGAG